MGECLKILIAPCQTINLILPDSVPSVVRAVWLGLLKGAGRWTLPPVSWILVAMVVPKNRAMVAKIIVRGRIVFKFSFKFFMPSKIAKITKEIARAKTPARELVKIIAQKIRVVDMKKKILDSLFLKVSKKVIEIGRISVK